MKILFVLNHFLPDQIAGTEIYTHALTKQLVASGLQVEIVIPNRGKDYSEEYTFDAVPVHRYGEPSNVDRRLIMGKSKPMGLPFFLEILQRARPDIVHFHELAGSNGISLHHVVAAKAAGFKTAMTFHLAGYSCNTGHLMYKDRELCDGIIRINRCTACTYTVKHPLPAPVLLPASLLLYRAGINTTSFNNKAGTALGVPSLIKKLSRDLIKLSDSCDRLVVLTDWYRKILIANGVASEKISLVTQGLPAGDNIRQQKLSEPDGTLKLIFVGRITRVKGLHLLLSALNDLTGNVLLDIYGQPGESEYVRHCYDLAEGNANIQWKGVVTPESVVSTIANYDLLCLPSAFSEMSPLVIQEAFAAGVPVLASNVYGNAEQIKHGENGWLFQFKNVDSLKDTLNLLLSDPSLIYRAKTQMPAVKGFASVAEEYKNLYIEMIRTA